MTHMCSRLSLEAPLALTELCAERGGGGAEVATHLLLSYDFVMSPKFSLIPAERTRCPGLHLSISHPVCL